MGIPLKKEGAEAYIYQSFDEINQKNSSNNPNMTLKLMEF